MTIVELRIAKVHVDETRSNARSSLSSRIIPLADANGAIENKGATEKWSRERSIEEIDECIDWNGELFCRDMDRVQLERARERQRAIWLKYAIMLAVPWKFCLFVVYRIFYSVSMIK